MLREILYLLFFIGVFAIGFTLGCCWKALMD